MTETIKQFVLLIGSYVATEGVLRKTDAKLISLLVDEIMGYGIDNGPQTVAGTGEQDWAAVK